MQTPTTDWEKVARALALLVVQRHFVERKLVEDADSAANTAGLNGASELARHTTTLLKGTRSATRVTTRQVGGRTILVSDPVIGPKPGPIVQPAYTRGRK